MTCYRPLKGFIVGETENKKKDMKIVPYDVECLFKPFGSESYERHGHILDDKILRKSGIVYKEFIPIPCGQCIGCRIDYSKQWATRCMCESQYHDSNYFLTLTYDDDHIKYTEYVDKDTGEFKLNNGTLVKKDLQDFNKRLRRALEYRNKDSFRFYACGEYGTISARPHYHMIAFGLELDDLVLYKSTPTGNLYTSEFLSRLWKHGYVIIGSVTYESCAYVSRYIMKKQKGRNASVYEDYNLLPEFVNMSRKPGIGKDFFNDSYEDIYPRDSIVLAGGKVVKPPKYFDNLMNEIDEELMNQIKTKRCEIAESIQSYKDSLTTETLQEQLKSCERNKEAQLSKLVRTL